MDLVKQTLLTDTPIEHKNMIKVFSTLDTLKEMVSIAEQQRGEAVAKLAAERERWQVRTGPIQGSSKINLYFLQGPT